MPMAPLLSLAAAAIAGSGRGELRIMLIFTVNPYKKDLGLLPSPLGGKESKITSIAPGHLLEAFCLAS
jgi:hypothetical protein